MYITMEDTAFFSMESFFSVDQKYTLTEPYSFNTKGNFDPPTTTT